MDSKKYIGMDVHQATISTYGPYKLPLSRTKPDPRVIIQYTFHAAQAEEPQLLETSAWSHAARELGVYEYFTARGSNCRRSCDPQFAPGLAVLSTVRAIDLRYLERWAAARRKPALHQMGLTRSTWARSRNS
jgi:hypothetical protein